MYVIALISSVALLTGERSEYKLFPEMTPSFVIAAVWHPSPGIVKTENE